MSDGDAIYVDLVARTGDNVIGWRVLLRGPAVLLTVKTPLMKVDGPEPDPLDVEYDGLTLRNLLERDRRRRQEDETSAWRCHVRPSTIQRAAVSAYWSAQLRAKVNDAADRDRNRVLLDYEDP